MLRKLGEQIQGDPTIGRGSQNWVRSVVVAVAVGIAFFLAAQLGLALLTTAERVAVFWPASGIAAGTLIALGPWARTPVAAGVLVATAAANVMSDRSLWAALAFGLCNAVEALLASWLIERWFGPTFTLDNLRRVLGFFGAAVVATSTAAVGASSAMKLFGPSTAELLDVWKVWFPSGALGMITVAPLLIGVAAAVRDRPSWRELLEGTLGVVAVTATIGSLLAILTGPWSLIGPASLLFPLLLWLGYRCRPVFAAASLFTISIAIVWTTTHEFGRYGDPAQPIAIRVIAAQIVMLGTALAALALAALLSERRRQEATVVASETRLRSILDAANVIAWDVDLIRNAVHTAGPVRRLLDRPEGSEPRNFAAMVESIHPEDRDRVMAQFWTAVSTASTYRLEFRLHPSGGGVRWVTAEGSIERDGQGRAVGVRGITRDSTARKQAELALAERSLQLALAGKAALVGSYAYDVDTEIMQISAGYAAIHGFPEGITEMARGECLAGVHPDEIARVEQFRTEAFRAGQREYSVEYRIIRAGGEVRWVETRCFIAYSGEGRPHRVVGVSIDITERKRGEEHLRMLVAELDHRVKNVLATVSAVTSFTQDASSSAADFVAALDGRIKSMAATHQLLSSHQWKGILLSDLVRRELAPYANQGNTEIGGPDITLEAEAGQAVSMVLHELTTNAAKHGALSTPDGRVSVRWYRMLNGDAAARLRIEWQESGGPPVLAPDHSGYGMEVIRDLLPYELDGKVDLAFASEGVQCRFDIPASQLTSGDLQRILQASTP